MPPTRKLKCKDKDGYPIEIPVDEAISLLSHTSGKYAYRLHGTHEGVDVASIQKAIRQLTR